MKRAIKAVNHLIVFVAVVALAVAGLVKVYWLLFCAFRRGYEYYVGVIDEDYRGDVRVLMRSMDEPLVISHGERVAQLVVVPCWRLEVVEVEELGETERGDAGFGSTGAR